MQGPEDTNDTDLIERVREGDRSAFSKLVAPHLPRLLGLARRMLGSTDEAEDALQNALASTWIARARLDPGKPVAPYLTTVSLNKCRDKLRRRKVLQMLGLEATDSHFAAVADAPGAEVELADRQELERVSKAIDKLPLRLREALVLVAVEGRSQREVAELLGVTDKTIETRVYRARQRLREIMKRFEG